MSDQRRRLGWVITLGALGLAVGGFALVMEQVDEAVERPPTGLAASNPYHALDLSLNALGLPTESRYGLGPLPDNDHVVVIFTDRETTRAPMADRLVDWVAGGGHLVAVAARDTPSLWVDLGLDEPAPVVEPDPNKSLLTPAPDTGRVEAHSPPSDHVVEDTLLARFNIWTEATGLDPTPQVHRFAASDLPPLPGGAHTEAALAPDRRFAATTEDVLYASIDGNPTPTVPVVSQPWGAGRVSALVDTEFLRNEQLASHDGAALFWLVVHEGGPPPAGAVLVLSGDSPSLAGILWDKLWPAIVALFVLTVGWLWRSAVVFGPPLQAEPPPRRSLLEHIDAVGAWLWRNNHQDDLLAELRRKARARLASRNRELAHTEGEAFHVLASRVSGVAVADVRAAFDTAPKSDRRAFVQIVSTLRDLSQERPHAGTPGSPV